MMARGGSVAVLSFSPVAHDQRVLRQVRLLRDMGHAPVLIGHGDTDAAVEADVRTTPAPRSSATRSLLTLLRRLPAHLGDGAARAGFWSEPRHRWALAMLREVAPRLVVANDWPALVVATTFKDRSGAGIHYDSHEFAPAEFDASTWWRLVHRPMAMRLERAAIARADSVSTVGPGLAAMLQATYALPARPAVVRNTPDRVKLDGVPPGNWPLRILYHGMLLPHRGLEALIDSVPLWRVPHRLILRGDGPERYVDALRMRAGTSARVTFEPAVPPRDVVFAAARDADVGIFVPPLASAQLRYSLPNKLFEYIAAGLAVVVTPGDDMRSIVEEHGVGIVCADGSPHGISAAIGAMTPETVTDFRQASLAAAALLCWEREQAVLRDVFSQLLGDQPNPPL